METIRKVGPPPAELCHTVNLERLPILESEFHLCQKLLKSLKIHLGVELLNRQKVFTSLEFLTSLTLLISVDLLHKHAGWV